MKKYKKFFSKVFAGVTIVCLLLGGNVGVAEAATFTFNQTDWSGGASVNTAIHPTNQTGWNKFSSASSTVKTSTAGEISLNSTTASITKTTDTDFSGGTFANTTVSGTGTAAKIRLAHSELAANATSLVGLWRMNGTVGTSPTTSGSVTDSQTNVAANHGTGYNSGSGLAYQPGELNQALQFDGTNDYVYMSSYTALAYPKTFEFWAMTDSVSQGGGARVILEKGSGTAVAVTILNRVIYVDTDDATSGTQYNTSNVGAVFDNGTYTSATIDLGQKINFSTLGFTKTTNASTTLTVDIRAGNTASPDGTWTAWQTNVSSGGSISGLNGNQYVQYRANLSTTDTIYTPSLDDITINYSYYYSSGSLISSAYDTTDSANLIGKIQWTESLPSGTDIKFQLRTSPDNSTWTNWLGPIGTSDYYTDPAGGETINSTHRDGINDRWVQYKVFTESDGAYTPTLSDVTLTYVVNAPPQFESAPVVLQIANSADPNWGKVQIQYSVRDPDTTSGTNRPGNDVIPSFEYNIGSGWQAITAGYLNSGALDAKIVEESNYTTYTAYWDAKAQIPESYIASAQIRVTIDDGEAANNTAQAAGNTFVLDTKNPVVSVSSFTIDSSADTVSYNFSVTDDSNITREYRISNNSDLSNDTLNASSTQWNAMPSSSVTATSAWNFTGSPSFETVYLGARGTDIYGNAATSTTASSTAPSQPQNFMIYDISNPNNNDFKEFMSWQIYTSTTTAQFSNYKLYRS
ncbi:MAG: hypothetical protein HY773_00005, partial [Candidatus Terrybacteria bacterium]|nr:hypothetical protein [Candidatus Terrybacteria bacterium]